MRYTAEGVRYFVDHNTKTTTFQDPRGGQTKGYNIFILFPVFVGIPPFPPPPPPPPQKKKKKKKKKGDLSKSKDL